nr:glutathione S-transferase [Brachionus rubens]
MSEEIFLYWGSGSTPCWRVQITLEEKQLKYGEKIISFDKQEHKSEEIMGLNPRGQAPTLKVGDKTINESIAACLYFEDVYKSQGTVLIPKEDQAQVLQRAFEALNLQKYCNENIVYYVWFTPVDKRDPQHLALKKKELNVEIQRWEDYLTKQNTEYIALNEFTFADVLFYPQLAFAVRSGYPIQKYPRLHKYYEMLKKRPSIEKTWPPHWKTTDNGTILSDC